jgi:hypothetical protein
MTRARWTAGALLAAAVAACAHAQGTPRTETGASYLGGRAAQPASWISSAPQDARSQSSVAQAPAGQANQPYSWIGEPDPAAPTSTPLAQDGPSYPAGRAAQPGSWLATPSRTQSAQGVAAAPTPARPH